MRFSVACLALGAAAAVGLAAALPAHAAGGHFEVDDAVMLVPGHCQVETWAARSPDDSPSVFHVGPSCRVGPVEVGLNVDHSPNAGSQADWIGPQVKWVVDPIASRLSTGVVWGVEANALHGGPPAQVAYGVATWWPDETLQVHMNAGADWLPQQARTRRLGLSGEWAANDKLSLLAERLVAHTHWTSRLGGRINLTDAVSLDLSASHDGHAGVHGMALGLNYEFSR